MAAFTSGEMSRDEFADFLTTAFANLIAFSVNGSIHYLFMDWRHLAEMVEATAQYREMKNLIFWNKQSAGMGSFYRSKHELIWAMKNGTDRHINNFGLFVAPIRRSLFYMVCCPGYKLCRCGDREANFIASDRRSTS